MVEWRLCHRGKAPEGLQVVSHDCCVLLKRVLSVLFFPIREALVNLCRELSIPGKLAKHSRNIIPTLQKRTVSARFTPRTQICQTAGPYSLFSKHRVCSYMMEVQPRKSSWLPNSAGLSSGNEDNRCSSGSWEQRKQALDA
ncbi:hypothetical protein NDU88_007842 [Pleurodeles waltl]|uniref:Uncharacterized protein n=1 Tax=Pleurodeles waltl TaxID=8319 RepID=A0AAV7STW5_PLEWA|nr:hypothetical protein NDU88_007842 [Pleurodeles waltl]